MSKPTPNDLESLMEAAESPINESYQNSKNSGGTPKGGSYQNNLSLEKKSAIKIKTKINPIIDTQIRNNNEPLSKEHFLNLTDADVCSYQNINQGCEIYFKLSDYRYNPQ